MMAIRLIFWIYTAIMLVLVAIFLVDTLLWLQTNQPLVPSWVPKEWLVFTIGMMILWPFFVGFVEFVSRRNR